MSEEDKEQVEEPNVIQDLQSKLNQGLVSLEEADSTMKTLDTRAMSSKLKIQAKMLKLELKKMITSKEREELRIR